MLIKGLKKLSSQLSEVPVPHHLIHSRLTQRHHEFMLQTRQFPHQIYLLPSAFTGYCDFQPARLPLSHIGCDGTLHLPFEFPIHCGL